MRVIEIDASGWVTGADFLTALRTAIGAPETHGWSPDSFVDSMIWGGMNREEPPYEIHIVGSEDAPVEVKEYIALVANALREGREWKRTNRGADTEVRLKTAGPSW
jgi:hypothetical protein